MLQPSPLRCIARSEHKQVESALFMIAVQHHADGCRFRMNGCDYLSASAVHENESSTAHFPAKKSLSAYSKEWWEAVEGAPKSVCLVSRH